MILENRLVLKRLSLVTMAICFGMLSMHAQFLLQAPNDSDQHNYKWFEASDTDTVLGTNFYLEVTQPGIYFATYDGTLCGNNASDYFVLTNCNRPYNEVTLDISQNVPTGATVTWSQPLTGNPLMPLVTSNDVVTRYVATVTKAGCDFVLPGFTVVCLDQSAELQDDVVTIDEDQFVIVDLRANDGPWPATGTLTTSNPSNGSIVLDNNGTPNDPSDDILTYTPDPDFNGVDSFIYTLCNGIGDCSTAQVEVQVLPIVDAIDDVATSTENTPVTIDILGNDNDLPTTGTLTITSPLNGTASIDDNGTPNDPSDDSVTYVPDANYLGTDAFEYTICDTVGNCKTAVVSVVVVDNTFVDIDTDDDGIIDAFEDLNLDGDNNPETNPTDTDNDGVPDYLDIDSDDDGLPDNIEAQTTLDYIAPSGLDANNNGLDDVYEVNDMLGLLPIDTDGDNLPDFLDEDSDNDNVPDNVEGHDFNFDGIADFLFLGTDKDNDGLDDGYENGNDHDNDLNDSINDPLNDLPNTDKDQESDYRDSDDDGDGIKTIDEDANGDGNPRNDDTDSDGTPDYLEANEEIIPLKVINVITPNGDGVHDVLEIRGLENYPKNTLKVYNRWGILVYSVNGYGQNGNFFDGTSQGRVTLKVEDKLPVGTYFYVLDYATESGPTQNMAGYIYLNR